MGLEPVAELFFHGAEGMRGGLVDQGLLGGELLVEAAVGQPGGLHQVGDTDTVGALLTHQARGGGNDTLPVLACLFLRYAAHGPPPHDWMFADIYRTAPSSLFRLWA